MAALDQAIIIPVATTVRLILSLVFYRIYRETDDIKALSFTVFFFLLTVHGVARGLAFETGSPHWFFLHRSALILSSVAVLYAVSSLDMKWIRSYRLPHGLAIAGVVQPLYDAYILGGVSAELNVLTGSMGFILAGIITFISAFLLIHHINETPTTGKFVMVAGLLLQSTLYLTALLFIQVDLTSLAFFLGIGFTLTIGLGAWLSFWGIGKRSHTTVTTSIFLAILLITLVATYINVAIMVAMLEGVVASQSLAVSLVAVSIFTIVFNITGIFLLLEYLSRDLFHPLEEFSERLDAVSQEHKTTLLEKRFTGAENELGEMARSVNRLIKSLKLAMKKVGDE